MGAVRERKGFRERFVEGIEKMLEAATITCGCENQPEGTMIYPAITNSFQSEFLLQLPFAFSSSLSLSLSNSISLKLAHKSLPSGPCDDCLADLKVQSVSMIRTDFILIFPVGILKSSIFDLYSSVCFEVFSWIRSGVCRISNL